MAAGDIFIFRRPPITKADSAAVRLRYIFNASLFVGKS